MTSLPIPGADGLTELLPCPFCGGAAEIKRNRTLMVSCTVCTATTFQELDDRFSAIRTWNFRARLAAVPAQPAPIQADPQPPESGNMPPFAAPAGQHDALPAVMQAVKDALTLISRNLVGGRWMRSDEAIVKAALGVVADYEVSTKVAVVEARPDLASLQRYVCDLRQCRGMQPDDHQGAWVRFADVERLLNPTGEN